ncbi:MAG: WD40 repeat domain-containing protein, partial [bacterium]
LGGSGPTSGDELEIYSFINNVISTNPVASKNYGNVIYSVDWSPDGKYLAIGGATPVSGDELQIYSFDNGALSSNPVDQHDYGTWIYFLSWDKEGKYLAIGGTGPPSGKELQLYTVNYMFDTTQQTLSNAIILGNSIKGDDYNLDVSVLGGAQGIINGYAWYDSTNSSNKGQLNFANPGASLVLKDTTAQFKISNIENISGWKEESIVLASGNDNSWLPGGGITYGNLGPETPPPARLLYHNSNAIINLQSDINENSNAIINISDNVSENSNAILGLEESIIENSNAIVTLEELTGDLIIQNSNAIFDHTQHFISLNNGKLYAVGEITGQTSIDGRAILSSPINLNGATLNNGGDILFSSQTTIDSSGYLNPQGYAYILGGDLIIPSATTLTFTSNGIIDGQGHSLIFGTTAQILIDSNVTLTLKNLTIKNDLSPISIPPIKCLDWYSKLVLDNVKFALNDDFAFKTGQMYIYDDVIFTGSSKLIYQSVLPSYIQPHSTLYFDEETTLDYSPACTLKDLIVLSDESSSIYLDGATLQTTHTGMRLTKGRLLLENKVTLSSAANNVIYDITYTATPISFSDRISTADLDPSNRYLAIAGMSNYNPDVEIYYFDGNVITGTPIAQRELGISARIYDLNWSPDNKNLAISVQYPSSGSELQIFSFDNENGSLSANAIYQKDFGTYSQPVKWHPSGKYIALGGQYPTNGAQLQIYSFINNSLSASPIFSETPMNNVTTLKWHPSGNFLVAGGRDYTLTGSLKLYSFYDNSLSGTPLETRLYGVPLTSVIYDASWSPDGKYLAVGGVSDGYAQAQIYSFYNNNLSPSPISEIHFSTYTNYNKLQWSPNGKYISLANQDLAYAPDEIIIIKVDNGIISSTPIVQQSFGYYASGTIWTSDSKYLFIYGRQPDSGYELQQYEVNYMFDTTQQGFNNSIIFGDSSRGSDYNLNSFVLGGARIEINGIAWFDDAN